MLAVREKKGLRRYHISILRYRRFFRRKIESKKIPLTCVFVTNCVCLSCEKVEEHFFLEIASKERTVYISFVNSTLAYIRKSA